jgi:glycine/serine hydroxymethyltransferase
MKKVINLVGSANISSTKLLGLIGIQLHEKYKENFDVSSEGYQLPESR